VVLHFLQAAISKMVLALWMMEVPIYLLVNLFLCHYVPLPSKMRIRSHNLHYEIS
jgi:hypothetical protein